MSPWEYHFIRWVIVLTTGATSLKGGMIVFGVTGCWPWLCFILSVLPAMAISRAAYSMIGHRPALRRPAEPT